MHYRSTQVSQIINQLYLANHRVVEYLDFLIDHNITHVLSLGYKINKLPQFIKNHLIKYLNNLPELNNFNEYGNLQ